MVLALFFLVYHEIYPGTPVEAIDDSKTQDYSNSLFNEEKSISKSNLHQMKEKEILLHENKMDMDDLTITMVQK